MSKGHFIRYSATYCGEAVQVNFVAFSNKPEIGAEFDTNQNDFWYGATHEDAFYALVAFEGDSSAFDTRDGVELV